MPKTRIEIEYVDEAGVRYKKVAENEEMFFLVPYEVLEDGGLKLDYANIKAYSKAEPDFPVEKVISYK